MTKVCFCGISGNGMSPLAQILSLKGYDVCGSDRSFDAGRDAANRKALEDMGIKIIPQDGSAITNDIETVYVSAALDENNPDIKAALKLGIPVKKRSDLLAKVFSEYEYGIAVGGTSGKTTTTAMIGYILDMLGKKPCMVNGGMLRNYELLKGLPNFIYNEDKICVIEADESDGSICKYHPNIALINNISHDHTSMEKLKEYFSTFAANTKDAIVVNYDCALTRALTHPKKVITFSTQDAAADFYAENIKFLAEGIELSLKSEELNFIMCKTITEARKALALHQFDLLIFDINLPDGNGLDFCRELKKKMQIPIALLTAKSMEMDIVKGLESGADDYITKPFSLMVLRARIRALLRRNIIASEQEYRDSVFLFRFETMEFYKNAVQIDLSKTEQRILYLLISNPNRILTREQLLEWVWPEGTEYVEDNALSVGIRRLRDKLEDDSSNPSYIKTIYGKGYVWENK